MGLVQDAKAILKTTTPNKLIDIYDQQEKRETGKNNAAVRDFFNYIGKQNEIATVNVDDRFLYDFLVRLASLGNPKYKRHIFSILKQFKYNISAELYEIIQIFDYYRLGIYRDKELQIMLNAAFSFKGARIYSDDKMSIDTTKGSFTLDRAFKHFGLVGLKGEEYHNLCHNLTNDIIRAYPNLSGIYYDIPYRLPGSLQHSVVYNEKSGMIYDLANDTSIPYEVYSEWYPNPLFTIKGSDFKELDRIFQNEFGKQISMTDIAGIQRIRKKQE